MEPESVLAEQWQAMIPMRSRHLDQRPARKPLLPPRAAQIERQSSYVRECKPQTEEEGQILKLFARGMSVQAVASAMGLGYGFTRRTIIKCHPEKKSLQKP